MAGWLIEAIPFLEKSDYEHVVNIYEAIVEHNPEEINNYWYLGLAYLFNGREEEAKTIWLMPFLELGENNSENLQQSLLEVLYKEAECQNSINNFQWAWLIREQIREINPNNLQNILCLLILSFKLDKFKGRYINDWNLIELIKSNDGQNINFNLIYDVLEKVLDYPLFESVTLTEAILLNQEDKKSFFDLIMTKAYTMGHFKKFFIYSANLAEICLTYQPQNLGYVKEIFWYYIFANQYDKAQEFAHYFYENSKTIYQQVFGIYFLLYSTLTKGNWDGFVEIVKKYKLLLDNLPDKVEAPLEIYIADSLIILGQPLLYIQDNPKETRLIVNRISSLFEQISQNKYSCPVKFFPILKSQECKKLKIGYIGHTLRKHSVGWLSRWLMQYHNREKFIIYTYLINQEEDYVTKKWFQDIVDVSVNFSNDVNSIVTQIENDSIDILVDLDSFTLNLTQMIMSLKPAPIQVSWLGMDSTGLPSIDYFIADPYVLPKDAEEYYQEKIWRLPHTYLGIDGFEVDVPNISRENLDIPLDAVIYLNIQNALKRHPDTIHLQMRIIKAVPNSYLFIKGNGDQEILKQLFISIAQEEGVKEDRLRFLLETPTEAIHRANLRIADIVLDTYPYNGATTTLESLWMEIPLVTRVGEQFAARNSYTFMINAGITEGIAWSEKEYIEWGIKLGTNEELRKEISWKLKQSKKTSPLWNGKQFAREMEKAYQQMWEIYVDEQKI